MLALPTTLFHKIRIAGRALPSSRLWQSPKIAFVLLSSLVITGASLTSSIIFPAATASALSTKLCDFGWVPATDNNELSHSGYYGQGTTVTLLNDNYLGVKGTIEIGNQQFPFILSPKALPGLPQIPGRTKTFDLPPPGSLLSQLPYYAGFNISVDSDAHLLQFQVKSTMCANDEYIWNMGVGVNAQYNPTSIEPKTGTTNAAVYVKMGRPVLHKVTMDYSTASGTAIAGQDFTSVKGVLTFNPGEQYKWINIPIKADSINEDTENFTVTVNTNSSTTNQNTTNVVNPVVATTVPIYNTPVTTPPPPVNTNPTAAFTWTRRAGAGNVVALNSSGSKDPDGTITGWRWVMNGAVVSTAASPTIGLGSGTSKTVTLTVTDNKGGTGSITKTLSLSNRAPRIVTISPDAGATVGSITPTLNASGADDDGDALQYAYHITGPSVDVSSGWVGGTWTVPPHLLDPGTQYQLVTSVKDPAGATGSLTTNFRVVPLPTAADVITTSTANGYWQVASDGGVFSYGDAQFYGSLPGLGIHTTSIMGMARTPTNAGYWLVGTDGGVFAFGDAPFVGSLPSLNIQVNNIVGMAPTHTGRGYWLVGADGGVFAFGDAGFYGSMGGQHLNAPVVSISPTPSGAGYWLAAKDGGVFAFGDAGFYGSMGGQPLNAPVTDMDATPDGGGYWMTAEDGGVFAFGNAQFYGSMAGQPLNGHITGMSATANGKGYFLNGCDGGIFAFGNAIFRGSNPTYQCRGV